MRVSYKVIGRNIRAARTDAGLTQEQTAELLRMSQLHFGRLERGERPASLEQISNIAAELGVPTMSLLKGCIMGESFEEQPSADAQHVGEIIGALASGCSPKARELMIRLCREVSESDKMTDKPDAVM